MRALFKRNIIDPFNRWIDDTKTVFMITTRISYCSYYFKFNKKEIFTLFFSFILLIISVISLSAKCTSSVAWLFLTASSVSIIIGLKRLVDRARMHTQQRCGELVSADFNIADIMPNEYDQNVLGYVRIAIETTTLEYVLHSSLIDNHIRNKSLKLVEDKEKGRKIRRQIENNKDTLFKFLNWQYHYSYARCKEFYNDDKLCLSQDLLLNSHEVFCHRGSYYDTFLTNQICSKAIQSNEDESELVSGVRYFPFEINDNKYTLQNINTSLMNNEIGVSTIGFTSDNRMLLWIQNKRAQSSGNLLVPTGSGSCDWENRKSVQHNSFKDIIIDAMNLELWQESGGKRLHDTHHKVGETRVLGYFRWINRGGKSEFVGITKLKHEFSAYDAEKLEVYEGPEVNFSDFDGLAKAIDKFLGMKISVPLYMNLKCLRQYYQNNSHDLKKLLFGSI